jgi:ketosteroid isomerase-like protein
LILIVAACSQALPRSILDAEAQAIRDLLAAWSASSVAKNIDTFLAFYDPDSSVFLPDIRVATGIAETQAGKWVTVYKKEAATRTAS